MEVDSALVTKQPTKDNDLKEDSVRPFQNIEWKWSKGLIVVHLDKREWPTVQDEFREAECGGNLPVGWVLWRVYSVNIPGYYKPVLIKKSETQKTLNVIECMTNGCLGFVHNVLVLCKMFVIDCMYCIMVLKQ